MNRLFVRPALVVGLAVAAFAVSAGRSGAQQFPSPPAPFPSFAPLPITTVPPINPPYLEAGSQAIRCSYFLTTITITQPGDRSLTCDATGALRVTGGGGGSTSAAAALFGQYNATSPYLSSGQSAYLQLDQNGALLINALNPLPVQFPTGTVPVTIGSPVPVFAASPIPVIVQNPSVGPTDAAGYPIFSGQNQPTPPALQQVAGSVTVINQLSPVPTNADGGSPVHITNPATPPPVQPVSPATTFPISAATTLPVSEGPVTIGTDATTQTAGSITNGATAPTLARAVQTFTIPITTAALTAASAVTTTTQPAGSSISIPMNGASTASASFSGTPQFGVFESTLDGTNWASAQSAPLNSNTAVYTPSGFTPTVGVQYQVLAQGATTVRFRVTTYTSGTMTASLMPTPWAPLLVIPTVALNGSSGGTSSTLTGNLAAGTASAVMSVGYCSNETLALQETTTATGTLTVNASIDNSHFLSLATTYALTNGANQIAISIPAPFRYITTTSSVAGTSVYEQLGCTY